MLSVFIRTSKGLMRPTGSDILYSNLMGSDIIVLNSFEAATELLDKRSRIYSSRYASLIIHSKDGELDSLNALV